MPASLRRGRAHTVCAFIFASAIAIAPCSAQSAPSSSAKVSAWAQRVGLWGTAGVGRASAGLHCEACTGSSTRAFTAHAAIGGHVSPRFLLGAEAFVWLDVIGEGVDRIARGAHLVARSYPWSKHQLYVGGGVGVASFRLDDGEVRFDTRAPSLSLGAGYDIHVHSWVLTPGVTAIASTGGDLRSSETGNAVTDNARLVLVRTSLAITWF